jgi:tetratricopeptide (TPR) repeat protein
MVSARRARPGGGRLAAVLATLLVVAGVVAWWRGSPNAAPVVAPLPRKVVRIERPAEPVVRPAPPSQEGYLGSEACAKCHADVAESYSQHAMFRASGATPGPFDIEDFQDRTEFLGRDGRTYRVEKRDDGIYHHEMTLDREGRALYDQAVKVSYFIGSGTRGKSYAIDHDGILFQSPISWYTTGGNIWDLSPGYEYNRQRFERRISDQCVLCHAGRPAIDPNRENAFVEPVLLEAVIGCERCHGPGSRHVALREANAAPADDDSMTNPATLSFDRRDAVCNQCHLQGHLRIPRYGRSFDDFRPGDRLDDIWAVLVTDSGVRSDGRTKAVSQAEQMYDSVCFKQSDSRLGCTSCHQPHVQPAHDEIAAYYRGRCLECHSEHGCSLSLEERNQPPAENSCIHCHMPRLSAHDIPHATQTDHRIVRFGNSEELLPEFPTMSEPAGELVVFDEQRSDMPDWERQRVRAIAEVREIEQRHHASDAEIQAVSDVLRAIVEIVPDDRESWFSLGVALSLGRDSAGARAAWERVLEVEPRDELALDALVGQYQAHGDRALALVYLDRLLAVNPWHTANHARRATLLADLGRIDEAIAAGEKTLELDPTDASTRRWLALLYQRQGQAAASRRHAEFSRQLADALRHNREQADREQMDSKQEEIGREAR